LKKNRDDFLKRIKGEDLKKKKDFGGKTIREKLNLKKDLEEKLK